MKTQKLKPIRIVVSRKRWLRGEKNRGTLRTFEGQMCCLGFGCLQHGATINEILDNGMPNDIDSKRLTRTFLDRMQLKLRDKSQTFEDRAAGINDDNQISDRQREAKLRRLGKAADVLFTFKP